MPDRLRVHVAERLDRVLGHMPPVVDEQGDEVVGCLRAAVGAEGTHGSDRGDRVRVGGGGHEQVDRPYG